MEFTNSQPVKYIGKGFLGYKEGSTAMTFIEHEGLSDAWVYYGTVKMLVRLSEIENEVSSHKVISQKGGQARSAKKAAAARENAAKPRFSKQRVLDYLYSKSGNLQKEYGFSDYTGSAQVKGRYHAVQQKYGEWKALDELGTDVLLGEFKPFNRKDFLASIKVRQKARCLYADGEEGMPKNVLESEAAALGDVIKDIESKSI